MSVLRPKCKVIMLEGIPGSGKTTLSGRIRDTLTERGLSVGLFKEGDLHPVDLAWCARLPLEEYHELLERFPQCSRETAQAACPGRSHAVVAYLKLRKCSRELASILEEKEVFDGKLDAAVFKALFEERFADFTAGARDSDTVYIFDCVLQNQINELLCFQEASPEQVLSHIGSLMALLAPLNPLVIYLKQADVAETIRKVAEQRLSRDKSRYPDWIDAVASYLAGSPLGGKLGLEGREGLIRYYEDRQKLELKMVEKFSDSMVAVEKDEDDWDGLLRSVMRVAAERLNH